MDSHSYPLFLSQDSTGSKTLSIGGVITGDDLTRQGETLLARLQKRATNRAADVLLPSPPTI
jgi:hypothetical protein